MKINCKKKGIMVMDHSKNTSKFLCSERKGYQDVNSEKRKIDSDMNSPCLSLFICEFVYGK